MKYLLKPKEIGYFFGDLKAIGHLGDLTSAAGDLLSGKSLLESLDGREDTINTVNRLFAGPKRRKRKSRSLCESFNECFRK